jgi:hypothetical protein
MASPFGEENKEEAVPKNLHDLASKLVSRAGLAGTVFVIRKRGSGPANEDPDPEKLFRVHDFKMGEAEKVNGRDAKVVRYRIDVNKMEEAEITLWVDSRTLLPVKRLAVTDKDKAPITETYKQFKLNPKLEDKTFELPK